jgi:methyl acetate hydrolase
MTKLVTSVAILQLVEAGTVDLDSEAVLATHCPELVALPILKGITDGVPELVARKSPLTVRHLLTHTSGLAYDFTSPLLAEYSKVTGKPSHWAASVEGYTLPLIFEPGSHWVYSTGIDWAGILIERVSGKRLSAYFHDHIFAPLGLTEAQIGFFPTDGVKAHLQQVCGRVADPAPGAPRLEHSSSPRTFDMAKMASSQLGGGGGLFGTARAYLRFLQGILASAAPGGILTPASYKELFTDSLPARGDGNTVHEGLTSMARLFGYADPDHVANSAQHLGHSVGLLLNDKDSVHGRRAGTGCWSGLARTYYWLDPATGIAVSRMLCGLGKRE